MADVSVVVVTYNALPWLERCLESVRGYETIVVDHGSTDGTLELVRERFPEVAADRAGEPRPRRRLEHGHARRARADYFLLLNCGCLGRSGTPSSGSRTSPTSNPDAAVVGPKLLNPDGSLQRSVRGFPTLWRLSTEYLFLRKLAPRTRALNAFYGAASTTTRCARPSC